MSYNVNFSGRETLLTNVAKEAKKIQESPQHKYFSERMIEGAEKVAEKAEKKIAADLNEVYRSSYAPYTVVKPKTPVEELEEFTKLFKEAHGSL